MRTIPRRRIVKLLGGVVAAGLAARVAGPRKVSAQGVAPQGRVVIVGGGFGGAACAKYLRRASPSLDITLVEKDTHYVSCAMSNAVIAGFRDMPELTQGYDRLARDYRIHVVTARAEAIDRERKTVALANSGTVSYDRLVLAPGIDIAPGGIEGYNEAAVEKMPHAWKAGPQTTLLRQQLQVMPDGGVFIVSVPAMPYRCPPGPYERASLVAWYLHQRKPRSKVLILDSNDEFPKQELFEEGWSKLYPGIVERVPATKGGKVSRVDSNTMTVYTNADSHTGDVVNIIPPERAGAIALAAGLADETSWCPVDPQTLESRIAPNVHVLGDAASFGAPKSAAMANTEAKVCAAAISAMLAGQRAGDPSFVNACYSLLAPDYGISIAMVYDVADGKLRAIPESVGASPLNQSDSYRAREAKDADGWYTSIVADTF